MGSSYCLSTDKNAMQNEQTINIRMCEENLEEKKIPPVSNLEIINKNINTNDNLSSNTGNNHINIYTNHTNFIMSNIITKNSKNNNTQKQRNNTEINVSKSKINKIVRQNKTSVDKYNHNDAKTEKKNTTKKLVALNNDVIVSGNEVNPEKIYLKTKLLGSGAFG